MTLHKNGGYWRVNLYKKGKPHRTPFVHVLVAEAFIGPKPEGMEVSHLDENRSNCMLENLAYVSHLENCNMPKFISKAKRNNMACARSAKKTSLQKYIEQKKSKEDRP